MRRLSPYRRPDAPAFVVATAVLTCLVTAASTTGPLPPAGAASTGRPPPSVHLTVNDQHCAAGWKAPTAGRVVFRIDNRSGRRGSVFIFNPYRGATAGHVTLRPHAISVLTMAVKPGRYRWSCHLQGLPVRTSSVATVRPRPRLGGPAGPTVQIPVTRGQLAPAITAYRSDVTSELALESTQVQALGTAVAGGQLAVARAAWLTAHLTWHRIGGAYDAFGDLGSAIDGTAGGLVAGAASAQFSGFHKVEFDLWQNDDLAAAAADTATLGADVHQLSVKFPSDAIPATELPLRTHEILEDALRDELSGDDDYGSGTDMASVEADVDGTRELLMLLTPVLRPRAPDLVATATADLNRLDAALAATESGGQWVAVTKVPSAQREQVNGSIGAVLEVLALVPALLQVVGSTT